MIDADKQGLLSRQHKIVLGIILLTGAWLRIYRIAALDLWYDEAYVIRIAQDLRFFFTEASYCDKNPPLYAILTFFWTRLFGYSESAVRSLSFIFNFLALPLIFLLAKRMFNPRIGLISTALLAVNPLHIWYAQEARGYSLSFFLCLGMVSLFYWAKQKNSRVCWLAFFVTAGLCLSASYFSLYLMILLFLIFIAENPQKKTGPIAAAGLFCLICLPLFLLGLRQLSGIAKAFWLPFAGAKGVLICFENLILGFNSSIIEYHAGFVFFLILLGAALSGEYRSKVRFLLVFFCLLPVVLFFVLSFWAPVFISRKMMIFSPFLLICAAAGIDSISKRQRLPAVVLFTGLAGLTLAGLTRYYNMILPAPIEYHMGVHPKRQIKPVLKIIKRSAQPQDVLVYSERSIGLVIDYYTEQRDVYDLDMQKIFLRLPEKETGYFRSVYKKALQIPWRPLFDFANPKSDLSKDTMARVFDPVSYAPGMRMWLLSTSWLRNGSLEPHSQAVRDKALEHYKHLYGLEYDGIYIDLFSLGPKDNDE